MERLNTLEAVLHTHLAMLYRREEHRNNRLEPLYALEDSFYSRDEHLYTRFASLYSRDERLYARFSADYSLEKQLHKLLALGSEVSAADGKRQSGSKLRRILRPVSPTHEKPTNDRCDAQS